MKSIVHTLSFMAGEIKHNLIKYVLASTGISDKYAIRSNVNPDRTVSFEILDVENNKLVKSSFTYEEFANLCSDVILMENTFTTMADMMLDALQGGHQDTVTITNPIK